MEPTPEWLEARRRGARRRSPRHPLASGAVVTRTQRNASRRAHRLTTRARTADGHAVAAGMHLAAAALWRDVGQPGVAVAHEWVADAHVCVVQGLRVGWRPSAVAREAARALGHSGRALARAEGVVP